MKKILFDLIFSKSSGKSSGSSLVRFFVFLPVLSPLGALLHNKRTFLKTGVFSLFFILLQVFYLVIDNLFDISEKTYFNF